MWEKKDDQEHMETILSLKKMQTMTLGSEMEKKAAGQPDHPAILYEDRIISYGQFNRLANQYANLFAGQGFKKGDVVAILMENRPEYLIAVAGLSKLGVIAALITNVVRGERLSHAINIAEARAIIVGHELLGVFQTIENIVRLKSPGLLFVETEGKEMEIPPNMQNLNPLLQTSSEANPNMTGEVNSEDILAYMYTAGNTGVRKAVPILQKRWLIMGHQFAMLGKMNRDTIQYMCLPLYYNIGFNLCFSTMLISGCTMVIKREFSVSRFWDEIRKYRANFFVSVGEMLRYLCNQEEKMDDRDNPLELVVSNGTRWDLTTILSERFGVKHVMEFYGTTEGIGAYVNEGEISGMCGNLNFRDLRQGEVVEYDIDGEEICRDENGWAQKCVPGQSGLLLGEINELNEFPGYVNETEATEARIVSNVFQQGDQYYNSGDLVQVHESDYISFVDRLGDTYRWKSKTVSAHQVADVLNKFFGSIEEAYVYGVKIPGLEGRCGMAALQLIEDVPMDWKDFVSHINKRMPSHARPIFIRICDNMDPLTFKQLKREMQQEGFNPRKIKDPLYFLDPHKDKYVPLTIEVFEDIIHHRIRL